ncbi:sodium ion-translocating decarboxylase subunit beta [Ruminococcus sp.]|jgi:oxaloacetate decarboxylase beta subunit|uniref:sodium ion-translocating decarboxylase subunit beta n=1 Tax=Ruminococcus sp. TaxID=41978 RepID=UPI0025D509A1|nr:sodium ion-translocating decarboxylase subunit beta [Ruminococcus sp.]MCI2112332.1 sodium ion-translocating decarboxylase subunit beta [Ruminococcus sp.]MDD6988844.1 sodium ion-translocating decarboxylase subunit beta [Ruminococcus sp.]MDY6202650.1 sodium ion-translocating decarboxylase subunit beta [Ruminococcus sp.]
MEILQGFVDAVNGILQSSGLFTLNWQNYVMIGVSILLLYLAIKKQYEPLLLLPIAFGMLLVNLYPAIMAAPSTELLTAEQCAAQSVTTSGHAQMVIDGVTYYENPTYGGLLYYLYQGVKLGIYPPLIFLGIGCMTDFGPLIANPKSLILGAAAQIGIFITFTGAIFLGFTEAEAGAIGIIGGADGPTAIYVTTKLAPHLLGSIAIAAYSYMALVPIIQPPIMKALTTKKERSVVMEQLRPVSKLEKIMFPVIVVILIAIFLPDAAPLVGMLMLGNLFKESGVVERLAKTAQNELMNIITIFLGTTVGATASGQNFLTWDTIKIIVLGLIAFCMGTACGILFGKLMYKFTGGKVNPLIGSAGVSAVPMAARVAQRVGQQENPGNFLLMHAMGPNVAGVIGSAVAAGVLLNVVG